MLADRVKETSTTTGTGAFDLDGAETGFQSFVGALGDGALCYYTIVQQDLGSAAEWETGIGTISSGSPDSLSRDSVLASSNAGSAVNFSSGTKDVFVSRVARAGGLVLLEETVVSGTPSSIEFTSFLGEFDHYLFRLTNLQTDSDRRLKVRVSSDGGSTWDSGASDYGAFGAFMAEGGFDEIWDPDVDGIQSHRIWGGGDGLSGDLYMHGAGDSSVQTYFTGLAFGFFDYNLSLPSDPGNGFWGGHRVSAQVDDGVQFLVDSGNFDGGAVRLYGVTD